MISSRCRLARPHRVAVLFFLLAPSVALGLELERFPYLQMATEEGIVVRWRTDSATDTQLRYGPSPGVLDTTVSIPGSRTEHEVALSGLHADTLYYYDIGGDGQVLVGGDLDHFFRTAPLPGTPKSFRIWVLGDSGDAGDAVVRVRNSFFDFTSGVTPDMVLMLGDNAYSTGTDEEHTLSVFQTFASVLRSAPLYATLGNHDTGSSTSEEQTGPFFDSFTLPTEAQMGGVASGTEDYYSFEYGNVHFVMLNSADTSRSTNGDMYSWLEADLMANTKDWLIAAWHHPPYSDGSHDSDTEHPQVQMRENFLPLLEDGGVDLVLAGHSHTYERSILIDGHYGDSSSFTGVHIVNAGDGDPNGTGAYRKPAGSVPGAGSVYAVMGSSSRLAERSALNHPVMVRNFREFGSVIVDMNGNTLNMRFLNDSGLVLDEFEIVKESACDDGLDNDDDGLIDLLDPGCVDSNDLTEADIQVACDDSIDNDGDGLIDYPNDPGCADLLDATEQNAALACDNGLDDDGDGFADSHDPGCDDALDESEQNVQVECDDGVDNDGDGFTDTLDPQCASPLGPDENAQLSENVSIPIASENDDVEERVSGGGAVFLDSADLDIGQAGTVDHVIGLRFVGVAIPQYSRIQSAFIQFTSDEASSGAASFRISAEASEDAPPFSAAPGDVSSRPQLTQWVSWDPADWDSVGLAGLEQQTPDLSALVQEIIDQPGWTSGSAMAFIITGSGERTAESFKGAQADAPRLEVSFVFESPVEVPLDWFPIRVALVIALVGSGVMVHRFRSIRRRNPT